MIGQTVSHYHITAKLGEGGMGVVYLAENIRPGREVALKLLPPQVTEHDEDRQRFKQEAHASARAPT